MFRLVWRFRPARGAFDERGGVAALPEVPPAAVALLSRLGEDVRFLVSPRPVLSPERWTNRLLSEGATERRLPLLWSLIYHAIPRDLDESKRGLAILEASRDAVEEAVLELEVAPPELAIGFPTTHVGCPPRIKRTGPSDRLDGCQGYLGSAPLGIGARSSWSFLGGAGEGVTLLDLEFGFNTGHEDLGNVVPSPTAVRSEAHGTMSLGVCCGDGRNTFGIIGVAHSAEVKFDQVERDVIAGVKYHLVAEALEDWIPQLPNGSVILLELNTRYYCHAPCSYNGSWMPLEIDPGVQQAIKDAAAKSIYVIEPAGNGYVDLDRSELTSRTSAIMVGGGTVADGDVWSAGSLGSNYGQRVDVHGWADGVATAGEPGDWADLQDYQGAGGANRCYTQSFNGTSSASAMVAGAVACLSGILNANSLGPISPAEMRDLLVRTGTPAKSGALIGPRPNLDAAITDLEDTYGPLTRRAPP